MNAGTVPEALAEPAAGPPDTSPGAVRDYVWAELSRRRQVGYPLPPHGHHPNFKGTGEAAALLKTLPPPDVVYLDPMYPHRTKSALPKKEMRLFRLLVGPDDDAARLVAAARAVALRRVVVKRPAGAPFLGDVRPDGRLESKNTRYDLYLTSAQKN